MPVQILISGDDPTALVAQVAVLHKMLTGGPNLPPVIDQSPAAPTPQPQAEVTSTRGRKKNAVGPAAQDPDRPEVLNRAENDFLVFLASGEQKSGFTHARDAVKLMAQLVDGLKSTEEIDAFSSANEKTLERMTDKERTPADEAIQKAYAALGVDPDTDNGDGNDEKEVTEADAKAALKAVADKEIAKATEILTAVGAKHWKDVKPDQYAKVMQLCDEARGLKTAPKPALFD